MEKVVAIAKMSPGIVRFYFDSKAAMLVASLQFLAAEFEEQRAGAGREASSPPRSPALELLVDLYLDPDIASPRKVSVWYAFWGEASSRQEYYDICGQKDESFALLVRELIGRLIAASGAPARSRRRRAGLIGVLEMLWQDFAFQNEANIDRAAPSSVRCSFCSRCFPVTSKGRSFTGRNRLEAISAALRPPRQSAPGPPADSPPGCACAADHGIPSSRSRAVTAVRGGRRCRRGRAATARTATCLPC